MAKDMTNFDADGFSNSRIRRTRHYAKWDAANGWRDRDDLPLPHVLVLLGIREFLRRWTKEGEVNKPTDITDQPLPDPEMLNAAIPQEEWPIGRDGKKEPPFKHYVGFVLVDPTTGALYDYSNSTWGAHELFDDVNESVTTMRAMRGEKCVPVVKPAQSTMPSKKFGRVPRPHFEILDWKTMGGGGNAIPTQPTTPQLSGPAGAPTPEAPTSETPAPGASKPAPKAKPKKPVVLSNYTLAVMGDVKKPTTEELMNDTLDGLPWDDESAA